MTNMQEQPDFGADPVVVVLGAGIGGQGVAFALATRAIVVVNDRDAQKANTLIDQVHARGGAGHAETVDLLDLAAVGDFRDRVLDRYGHVDAVIHLIGGWRGSTTVDAQAIEQWQELLPGIVTTVQTTSVAFREVLAQAPQGRYVMVTSTAVKKPSKTNAAYAAAKAAAQTWVAALDDAFSGTNARAHVVAVMALVDAATRAANPDKTYKRFTDVADLGAFIAELIDDTDPAKPCYLDLTQVQQ